VKRVHEIPPTVCSVCEARKVDPRFGEWVAFIERNRKPDESWLAAQQRVSMDLFFDFYGNDIPGISRALAVNPSTVACMQKRRYDAARTLRLVKEQSA